MPEWAGVSVTDSYAEVGRIDHERHEVRLLSAGRHGAWAECSCGWTSASFAGVPCAQYAWALHVRDEAEQEVGRALDQL